MKLSLDLRHDIRQHSLDLRHAQKSLRVLSALRWDPAFEAKFHAQDKRPKVSSVHFKYPRAKPDHDLLKTIAKHRKENRKFEKDAPDAAKIFDAILDDFDSVHALRLVVGQDDFGQRSATLYGSLNEPMLNVAHRFSDTLDSLGDEEIDALYPKVLSAEALQTILRDKLRDAHLIQDVDIIVTENLSSDAAAGGHYVKLKKHARFSIKDADLLLHHEIFTHVVTGLNGKAQLYAKWLGFDSPLCTVTQEGLAVFLEVVSGKSHPRRLRKIVDRIILLEMISNGEHAGHLYDWLRERRYSHKESMHLIARAFRGLAPGARDPFTKDLTYLQGLISIFNFVKANLVKSRYDRIEALFMGKLPLGEIPALLRLQKQGVVQKPRWIPPQFLDLDSLITWFSCVMALGSLDDKDLQKSFT